MNFKNAKKIACALLALIIAFSAVLISANAEEESVAYVTIADENGELVLIQDAVTLADTDNDGMLTISDALYLAHEKYYDGGAEAGYGTEETEWGLSLAKLWGVANGGSYGYYVNNNMAWGLTDAIADGDMLYAFIYTDTETFSDTFSFFNENTQSIVEGETVALTLSANTSYDENWNPVAAPIAGAEITIDGEKTGIFTDENGYAEITFDKAGEYVVSAYVEQKFSSNPPTDDTDEIRERLTVNITPPVCVVTVADFVPGDANRDGVLTVLDATRIQRYKAKLVTEKEINLKAADVTGDGEVTVLDATRIQRTLAKLCNLDGSAYTAPEEETSSK